MLCYLIPLPVFFVSMIASTVTRYKWVSLDKSGNKSSAVKMHIIFGSFQFLMQISAITTGFLGFILCSNHNFLFAIPILSGLCVSICGDIALIYNKNDFAFMVGIFFFFIALVLYFTGLFFGTGLQLFDLIPMGIMLTVYILLVIFFIPLISRRFKFPIAAYGFIWCLLIAKAITTLYCTRFSIFKSVLLCFGTIVFFTGDIRLAIYRFINSEISMSLSPVMYGIGQICIAMSLGCL